MICRATIGTGLGFLMLSSVSAFAEELRIFCYDGYAPPEMTSRFTEMYKKKTGKDIKVFVSTVANNADVFGVLREKKADIVSPTNNGIKSEKFGMISKKLLLPIDVSKLKNYSSLLKNLQKADYITEGGQVYGVPLNYGPYGLAYNTNLVKNPPTSWKDLLKPGVKFSVSKDWYELNVYVAALAAGVSQADLFNLTKLDTPEVKKALKHIASNAKTMWVGVDDAASLKGLELATSFSFAFTDLAKQKEIWKMASPVEGTTGYVDNFSITANIKPELIPAAMEWLDFTISPEEQAAYFRNISVKPVNPGVKSVLNKEELMASEIENQEYFNKLILWKALDVKTENGLANMWKEATKK